MINTDLPHGFKRIMFNIKDLSISEFHLILSGSASGNEFLLVDFALGPAGSLLAMTKV